MVVQWVIMLVILQILVLECETSILLYSKIISPLEIQNEISYKFYIGIEHIIIYHGFRVYLTMIGQYKWQYDDEMTSKDDKSIRLICYMCIG
jgi:hypothetical protein